MTIDMFQTKETESIEFIQQQYAEKGICNVAFSGGKDSVVVYDLVKKSGIPIDECFYCNTTIDPPELIKFIKDEYPEVVIYNAPPFFVLMKKKGYPSRCSRWCCDTQKKKVGPQIIKFTGVRAQESCARQARGRISKFGVHPIFAWTTDEIWEYIHTNKLSYCRLYDQGFDRIGCVICPFVSGWKMIQAKERWPKYYRVFDDLFKKQIKEKHPNIDPEVALQRYYYGGKITGGPIRENEIEWEYE